MRAGWLPLVVILLPRLDRGIDRRTDIGKRVGSWESHFRSRFEADVTALLSYFANWPNADAARSSLRQSPIEPLTCPTRVAEVLVASSLTMVAVDRLLRQSEQARAFDQSVCQTRCHAVLEEQANPEVRLELEAAA